MHLLFQRNLLLVASPQESRQGCRQRTALHRQLLHCVRTAFTQGEYLNCKSTSQHFKILVFVMRNTNQTYYLKPMSVMASFLLPLTGFWLSVLAMHLTTGQQTLCEFLVDNYCFYFLNTQRLTVNNVLGRASKSLMDSAYRLAVRCACWFEKDMFSEAHRALTPTSWHVAQRVKSSPTINHQNLFYLTVLKQQSVKARTTNYVVSAAYLL